MFLGYQKQVYLKIGDTAPAVYEVRWQHATELTAGLTCEIRDPSQFPFLSTWRRYMVICVKQGVPELLPTA